MLFKVIFISHLSVGLLSVTHGGCVVISYYYLFSIWLL